MTKCGFVTVAISSISSETSCAFTAEPDALARCTDSVNVAAVSTAETRILLQKTACQKIRHTSSQKQCMWLFTAHKCSTAHTEQKRSIRCTWTTHSPTREGATLTSGSSCLLWPAATWSICQQIYTSLLQYSAWQHTRWKICAVWQQTLKVNQMMITLKIDPVSPESSTHAKPPAQ